jgi:4-oxalocrotonate tautomerase
MPTLHLEMLTGRTLDQKRAFVREATRVAVETLACAPEAVNIVITEVPRDAWARGGKLLSES